MAVGDIRDPKQQLEQSQGLEVDYWPLSWNQLAERLLHLYLNSWNHWKIRSKGYWLD